MTKNTHALTQRVIQARSGKATSNDIYDRDVKGNPRTIKQAAFDIKNQILEPYKNIPANDRKCTNCIHDIGDEFHYVCLCPIFNEDREKYLDRYTRTRPNMQKFINLINTENITKLRKLSINFKVEHEEKFIYFFIRNFFCVFSVLTNSNFGKCERCYKQ